MKNYFKLVLILVVNQILSLNFQSLYSQNTSSEDSTLIAEKVYLHIDRDSYYPGDDIWFKAYLIDATYNLLTSNSSNLHVELISPELKILNSQTIRLTEGLGNGDFHLPDTLESGVYSIRAYTNYMRNFGDELFFSRNIIIINVSGDSKEFSGREINSLNNPEISFYPEGGSLVENVVSKVAFKATDADGSGVDLSGEIYSSAGEKMTGFKSTHKGMGTFILEPAPGLRYFAIIKNRYGDSVRYELPESFSKGIVLNVSGNDQGLLSLTFKTNNETLPLIMNQEFYLTIAKCKIPFETYSSRIKSLNSFIDIPSGDLPEGIFMLTLSGSDNKPVCERLIFIGKNHENIINLETSKAVYGRRDSVSVRISLADRSGTTKNVFLSASAAENIFTDNSSGFPSTISSWFLLESDIHGSVEEPSYYFDISNPDRLRDLDLLLLTQGWRDFEWKYREFDYPAEHGFSISGRVRKKFVDEPFENTTVTVGIFDNKKPSINIVPIDDSGRFLLKDLYISGKVNLIASVTNDKDKLKGWLILDSTRYNPAKIRNFLSETTVFQTRKGLGFNSEQPEESQSEEKTFKKYIQYSEFKEAIRKKYKLSDTIKLGEVKITAKRIDTPESAKVKSSHYLRGIPDREFVVPPDYKGFSTAYLLVNARFVSPVRQPLAFRMQNPFYMINGTEVTEDDIKALPMSMVDRIDVLQPASFFANFGRRLVKRDTAYVNADGAISIILREDLNMSRPQYHSVNVEFSGYSEPRIFYSPRHHTTLETDYKPDLRTTLYWQPDIRLESNKDFYLNFYNSDNSSAIKVIVEGITGNGIPVTGKTEYTIDQQSQ